jgi:hypothetical protein
MGVCIGITLIIIALSRLDVAALLRFINLIHLEIDDFTSYQELVTHFKEELKGFIQW